MNRRDALKSLLAAPGISAVAVASVQPHDVIVVKCDQILSREGIEHLKRAFESVFPSQKILVLDRGLDIQIKRPI